MDNVEENQEKVLSVNKQKSKKKLIIVLSILFVVSILLIVIYFLDNRDSRYYDYNDLITRADEKKDYFTFDCKLDEKNEKYIDCNIRLNKEATTSVDSTYILEYFILDYREKSGLSIETIKAKRIYENLPSYYNITNKNNRLLVENADDSLGYDIYHKGNISVSHECGKEDGVDYTDKMYFVCNDTIENFEIIVRFKILNDKLNTINIDKFGTIYTYICNYKEKNHDCRNYKYSNLSTSVEIKKEEKADTIDDGNYDYSDVIVPIPEKEINIDISNTTEVLNLGNRLWKFAFNTYWGSDDVRKYFYGENNKKNDFEFCKKNMNNVSQKYTSDFIYEQCLNDSNCSKFNINQFLEIGCVGGGRGGLQDYKTTSLKVDSIKDDEIHYVAVSEYCGGSFCHETPDTVKTVEKPFIIKKVDNEWKINYFYIPN